MLQHRTLGHTGLQVSPIGLGTVKFGRNTAVKYPKPFNIPDDLFAEIEQMAENEMLTSGKLPSDNMDDKQNILR